MVTSFNVTLGLVSSPPTTPDYTRGMYVFDKIRKALKKEEPDVLPTLIETNIVIEPVPIKENVKPKIGRKVVRVRTDEQINNEILSFLKLSNTPQNTQAVANKVNIRHTSTKNRLRFMEFSGLVESYEKGQWVYWKIKRS